jgi:hypothetical protein
MSRRNSKCSEMKRSVLSALLILSLVSFGLTSCEKEEGPQGPPGPAGEDGNANVKTEIVTFSASEWVQDGSFYAVGTSSDLLTQKTVGSGSAHLYLEAGEDLWAALPYYGIGFGVTVNTLTIIAESPFTPNPVMTFKLVVIEGNMNKSSNNVDFNNYNAVKDYYNLDD